MEVNCPGQRATVLVAFAWMGRTPTPMIAGNDKKEPPPAIAFKTPARNEAITSQLCCHILSVHLHNQTFQIFSLGDIQNHGMIGSGSTPLEQPDPALRISGISIQEAIKDNAAGMASGRSHERFRSILVISEVSLACLLLVGAGLLLHSFLRVLDVDLGFNPAHAAAMQRLLMKKVPWWLTTTRSTPPISRQPRTWPVSSPTTSGMPRATPRPIQT